MDLKMLGFLGISIVIQVPGCNCAFNTSFKIKKYTNFSAYSLCFTVSSWHRQRALPTKPC